MGIYSRVGYWLLFVWLNFGSRILANFGSNHILAKYGQKILFFLPNGEPCEGYFRR